SLDAGPRRVPAAGLHRLRPRARHPRQPGAGQGRDRRRGVGRQPHQDRHHRPRAPVHLRLRPLGGLMRHWFGQSPTDWTMVLGAETESNGVKLRPAIAAGPIEVTFWDAATGGTQYTDLLDASGEPITHVTTADGTGTLQVGTIPRFRGPDDVTEMWADAGGGARYLMVATSLGAYVADLRTRVSDLEATVELLTSSLGVLVYDGGWPERPVDDRPYAWIGPSAPTGADGDLWFDTTP